MRETGKTRRRAWEGRGTKARRSGSSIEKTSEKPKVVGRPSWWIRWDMTSGLFSGFGLVCCFGGFAVDMLLGGGLLTKRHEGLVRVGGVGVFRHLGRRCM